MRAYLNKIKSPGDLKKLNIDELNSLCGEIRSFLIDSVSETGGHLASNLGVVELSVAIHTVFDMPKDKIVFDVGHQSYVHKILTGRAGAFDTLRRFGGLSGFPKRAESEYDAFNTGHSSTSISAALGLARARDLSGGTENIIALFGDGALTGGMMYEAMNDAGHSKTPLILILNDNNMSITKNVGSITNHLRRLRISPKYFKSKEAVEGILKKVPFFGEKIADMLRKIKRKIRRKVLSSTMFEDLGFSYIGPVDGHDLKALIPCLEYAKKEKKPILIHVITKKGKGYYHAETNSAKFHGIGPFNVITGATKKSPETYSAHFGKTLVSLAEKNEKIVAVTAAMPTGTGLTEFADRFKNRFFDVGIAEQHGVTMAAGLAAGGFVPVIPLYSSFLQRAYDQTLHDVCLQNLHVVFPIDRAGIVGADGETHQGIYDISYLSHMPNMTVLSPVNFKQLDEMLDYAVNTHNGPIAIRYPKGSEQLAETLPPFDINSAVLLSAGTDISIIAAGRMANRAREVMLELENHDLSAEILLIPAIKPIDEAAVIKTAKKTGFVVTMEDNVKIGGMGETAARIIAENNINCKVKIFAFPDKPIVQGSVAELDRANGLDKNSIVKEVLNGKNKT
ncbi:MAG: 1-deoxy-D-xylulose-5-phosphate synthase [Firmicutes bacterium]|nr:1-deoxy-D-xylulose-5-phosphate synthase [Bacillota bacterium]